MRHHPRGEGGGCPFRRTDRPSHKVQLGPHNQKIKKINITRRWSLDMDPKGPEHQMGPLQVPGPARSTKAPKIPRAGPPTRAVRAGTLHLLVGAAGHQRLNY